MNKDFDIQEYMTKGVERIVSESIRATLKNPKESAFMLKFALASRRAAKKRAKLSKNGENVPPFLIASITSSCNLHCVGCYSRCNQATTDSKPFSQLTGEEWRNVFVQAKKLGMSYVLLAGGEPMLRRDVIESAAKIKNIIFPIFTNGTYLDERYLNLFDKKRNLIPVMSIEGEKEQTDNRRGKGVYDKLISNMDEFKKRDVVFGASVTVTTENFREVTGERFISTLLEKGCKLVIFVEFVPVTDDGKHLAFGDKEREYFKSELMNIREKFQNAVFVAFPGDEKSSGGCIAAGRGFFHVNSHGGAEPCPFSPYSDVNVKETSLREALKSKLFKALIDNDLLKEDHVGGCILNEKKEQVEQILKNI